MIATASNLTFRSTDIKRLQRQGLAEPEVTAKDSHSPARPPPIRTVLVPVDGTAASEHALPHAASIARRAGAQIVLAHIYSPLYAPRDRKQFRFSDPLFPLGPVRDHLSRISGRVMTTSGVPVRTVLHEGTWIDDALERIAVDQQVDMVVMATGTRGWWDRITRPSVTAAVVRRFKCPVMLVRGSEAPANFTREPPVRRILIPLDRSARAEEIFEPAVGIGTVTGGSYDLIHAIRPIQFNVGRSVALNGALTIPTLTQRAEAARYLQAAAMRFRKLGHAAHWQVVVDDRPTAEALVRYAERTGADLIALATYWRGLLSRFVCGSVAQRVVRKASVPVLIHRS